MEQKWTVVLLYAGICGMIFTHSLTFLYIFLNVYLVGGLVKIYRQNKKKDKKFMVQFAVMIAVGIYYNFMWLTSVLNHDTYVLHR